MAVRQNFIQYVYGIGDNLLQLPPQPIIAQRNPTTADFAQLGTIWVNEPQSTVYTLASITANSANWQTSPASGVGIFASAVVNPGDLDVDAGDVNITLGDLNVLAGTSTFSGPVVASSTALFSGALTATGAITLNSGVNAINISTDASATAVSIATGAAVKTTILGSTNATSTTTVRSGTGGTLITSTDEVLIDCAGVLELNSSAGVIGIGNDAVAQAINVGTGAAARTITVGNITTTTAVNINSGTGGINLSSAGRFTLDAVADTQASPSATSIINANVGAATFTGFTTAAAATQDFTITNSLVSATSQILCTVCNEGANDAQINIRRITRAAGSFVVKVVNDGAAALNGNVTITFIVLN